MEKKLAFRQNNFRSWNECSNYFKSLAAYRK